MPSPHEILCINKNDRLNPQERITNLGGKNPSTASSARWKLSLDEAIASIENRKYSFYVNKGGSKVDVIVSTGRSGRKNLKTNDDGEEPNNLLSLDECP